MSICDTLNRRLGIHVNSFREFVNLAFRTLSRRDSHAGVRAREELGD